MKLIKDLGMQYTSEESSNPIKYRFGIFECPDCLAQVRARTQSKSTRCRSCANKLKNVKHNGKGTRLYTIWQDMKNRCYNKNVKAYKNYGAKGVTVCDEWKDDFVAFRNWSISNGYNDTLTIDKDVMCKKLFIYPKIYSPLTVIWITKSENAHAGK